MTDRESANLSDSDHDNEVGRTNNVAATADFHGLFARKAKPNAFQNRHAGTGWQFRLRRNSQDSVNGRRKDRAKKQKNTRNVLPAVRTDDHGAVYLPRSDGNSQLPQDPAGREVRSS